VGISILSIPTARIIAVMTFCTGCAGIVDGMAILAGGVLMVDAISTATAWMREGSIPIARVVALSAVGAEHPRMDGRFGMTGCADSG
jgi:hypothetical protein